MKIQSDAFVSIRYTLTDDDGNVLDQSKPDNPLGFVCGRGMIIPGLEAALIGLETGDKRLIDVSAKDGYGDNTSELLQELPRESFPSVDTLEIGQTFQAKTPHGLMRFVIHDISDKAVTVDLNHPLAGKDLHFDVEVMEVRAATETDLLPPAHDCQTGDCGACDDAVPQP